MQCPLSGISGCFMTPPVLFSVIAALGLTMGIFSSFWPERSISFYQWIMERFNWKVAPIDGSKELRNTRILGIVLIPLSVAILTIVFFS